MLKGEQRKTGSSREYGEIKLLTTDEELLKNIGNKRQMTLKLSQASSIKPSGSLKKQPASEIHIKTNGRIEKDQEKVANVLANYFSTMANDIGGAGVNSLTEDDLSSHSSLTNICNANKSNRKNFCFQPLSSNLVQLALEKLNIRKAWGYDSISPRMLRLASSGISDSLTKLFNEYIRKGEWPEAWKKGEWNPVHKKDDRLDERNYRPITLLSTVDKVFESMMSIQVYNDKNATYEEL